MCSSDNYVNTILADTQLFAAAYIDDIAVYSEDHMRHLKIVLTKIKESGLTIKLSGHNMNVNFSATKSAKEKYNRMRLRLERYRNLKCPRGRRMFGHSSV